MIFIDDGDLPITAAQKIVTGTRRDEGDMFTLEEIREIATYLLMYWDAHKETGDYEDYCGLQGQ